MAGSAINLQGCFDRGWIVDGCPQFAYPNRISIEVPVSAGKGLELLDSNPPAWPVRFRNVLSSNSVGRTPISFVQSVPIDGPAMRNAQFGNLRDWPLWDRHQKTSVRHMLAVVSITFGSVRFR